MEICISKNEVKEKKNKKKGKKNPGCCFLRADYYKVLSGNSGMRTVEGPTLKIAFPQMICFSLVA